MSGYGDGTNWSSERGDGGGYAGSSGNAGNGISGNGGSVSNGPVMSVNKSIGDGLARQFGINPAEFVGYVLGADGNVLGITRGLVGDAYGVNLGYPAGPTGNSGAANSAAPGGTVPANVDISPAREAVLKKVIEDNAKFLSSGQSGTRITQARNLTDLALSELAIIYDTRKNQPSASDLQDALKLATDFYSTAADKFGSKASQLAQSFAEQAKGKKLRNARDALTAFDKYRYSIATRFGEVDRKAIANALKSADYSAIARDLKRYSKALGYYGPISDVADVVNEIRKALETNTWRPVFEKIETIAAGKVATAAVALSFAIITSTPLGIIGYAVLMALVGAMINDALIGSINKFLGI